MKEMVDFMSKDQIVRRGGIFKSALSSLILEKCQIILMHGLKRQKPIQILIFWSYGDIDLLYGDIRKFVTSF